MCSNRDKQVLANNILWVYVLLPANVKFALCSYKQMETAFLYPNVIPFLQEWGSIKGTWGEGKKGEEKGYIHVEGEIYNSAETKNKNINAFSFQCAFIALI